MNGRKIILNLPADRRYTDTDLPDSLRNFPHTSEVERDSDDG